MHALDQGYAQAAQAQMTPAAEQRWLRHYLPLVRRIVSQLSPQSNQVLDREDMEQIGLLGLLESLRRYGEPDERFLTFAGMRIRGAILDEFRRQDWRPRQTRQRVNNIRETIRVMTRRLGRAPLEEEILAETGLNQQEFLEFERADFAETVESLDALLQDGHEQFAEEGDLLEERLLMERLLTQALSGLDEREQLILTLYYQRDMTLKEIALVLDLTVARVSQLCKQAIANACRFLTTNS